MIMAGMNWDDSYVAIFPESVWAQGSSNSGGL